MNPIKKLQHQEGITLIEVLLSITILGIILLTFMHFFLQAGTFTNANQKKTVAVNVARNALMFMEKQNFLVLKDDFLKINDGEASSSDHSLHLKICNNQYEYKNEKINAGCEPIKINNVPYEVLVSTDNMDDCYNGNSKTPNQSESNKNKKSTCNYYIPIKVEVRWAVNDKEYQTSVEGTVKSEDLR